MIKAIIIDDEKNGAEVLQLLIQQNCEAVEIIAIEYSAEAGIMSILNLKPDLVFLDIEMPTATGFDVIEATKENDYEIIFTTAYEHYAIKALKANAVDYLLKPIDVEELINAVNTAKMKITDKQKNNYGQQLELLLKKMAFTAKKIAIPTGEGIMLVATEDIIQMESDSNYTNVFLKDGRKILISKTLKCMEEQLKNQHFLRVHSAHLININEIERYIRGDGGQLILKNNLSIPVSRAHKQELLNMLGL
jgi:two-component system, LytTR family, response regulator